MTFTPPVPSSTPAAPKWLALAAVGVVVIATFGIVGGLSSPLGLFISKHHAFAGMPGSTPELARMIALQEKMMAPPAAQALLVAGAASLIAGAWALYCAIRVLSGKRDARVPFRESIVVLGAAECVNAVVGTWLQIRNREIMGEFVKGFPQPTSGTAPGFERTMQAIMQASLFLGLVVAIGWAIGKLVFLVWAHRYVATPKVVAHFDR